MDKFFKAANKWVKLGTLIVAAMFVLLSTIGISTALSIFAGGLKAIIWLFGVLLILCICYYIFKDYIAPVIEKSMNAQPQQNFQQAPVQQQVPVQQAVPTHAPVSQAAEGDKFCTNCGSKVPAGNKFCNNCGNQMF